MLIMQIMHMNVFFICTKTCNLVRYILNVSRLVEIDVTILQRRNVLYHNGVPGQQSIHRDPDFSMRININIFWMRLLRISLKSYQNLTCPDMRMRL